jgi:hypothetical protein
MRVRITTKLILKILSISIATIFVSMFIMGYVGYRLYKNVITAQETILENQNQSQITQEQKAQELVSLQQKALELAKDDLNKTKIEAKLTDAKLQTLTQTVTDQAKLPKEIIISSNDLAPYLTGVVQVICSNATTISSGSGTLWNFKGNPYVVMTNLHVVKGADKCVVSITNTSN